MRDRVVRALAGVGVGVPFALGLTAASDEGPDGDVVFSFQDPEIVESSGLVVDGDLAFTVNDSGDFGRVFAVDTETGETVGVTNWADGPDDVEAVAPAGPGEVWVGDIGDNTASRDLVTVTKVPVGRGELVADEPTYDLSYPDGPRDAEALLVHPETGRVYVVTKGVFGGELLQAPPELGVGGPNMMKSLGQVLGIVTDGAFFPDGKHLALRTYSQIAVYGFPSLELLGSFDLPQQEQGEGIAVVGPRELWLSSEGRQAPVLRVRVPARVAAAMASAAPESEDPTTPPPPTSGAAEESPTVDDAVEDAVEDVATEALDRDAWWLWLTGGGVLLVAVFVLLRALRPR